MGAEIILFIVSNPWRTACLAMVIICLGLTTALRFEALRLTSEISKRQAIEAQISVMEAVGQANDAKLATAAAELDTLQVRQKQANAEMNRLLKSWPADCDAAGVQVIDILQGSGDR